MIDNHLYKFLVSNIHPLLALVQEAGVEVISIYNSVKLNVEDKQCYTVTYKSDASPLTQADLVSHRLLTNGLNFLVPDIPVVSEEDVNSLVYRTSQSVFWLIDPLDGTKEFIAQNGEFTINLALIHNGEPIFGIVSAPALQEIFWGGREFGAYMRDGHNERFLYLDGNSSLSQPYRIIASKSHLTKETSDFIESFCDAELLQVGSSLKFCRIAQGHADLYPRLGPTCEWDTAAAQAVLEGAGGYVNDLNGFRLYYGKSEIINPSFIASSRPFGEFVRKGSTSNK